MSKEIEKAIRADDWLTARALIRTALKSEPTSHWLIARLGLTYYEQRQYKRALRCLEKAMALAPSCPLVLWDYAGALDMLGRTDDAIRIYRRLINRGVERIAVERCGEGKAWARGLIADCHFRLASCLMEKGRFKKAEAVLDRHIALRGRGCRTIYGMKDVRKQMRELKTKKHNQKLQAAPLPLRA
jgi:tetratricopeptide (TPR) repeat protein